jgi:hypothetical protein
LEEADLDDSTKSVGSHNIALKVPTGVAGEGNVRPTLDTSDGRASVSLDLSVVHLANEVWQLDWFFFCVLLLHFHKCSIHSNPTKESTNDWNVLLDLLSYSLAKDVLLLVSIEKEGACLVTIPNVSLLQLSMHLSSLSLLMSSLQ